jgi:hypothetical protein
MVNKMPIVSFEQFTQPIGLPDFEDL